MGFFFPGVNQQRAMLCRRFMSDMFDITDKPFSELVTG